MPVLEDSISTNEKTRAPLPDRFQTSKSTLLMDRFMTHFIKMGGISVMVAVSAIFVFVLIQIFPLFQTAKVKRGPSYQIPAPEHKYIEMGADEWGEFPFFVDNKGKIFFFNTKDRTLSTWVTPQIAKEKQISTVRYISYAEQLIYGTEDGWISIIDVKYKPKFTERERKITVDTDESPAYQVDAQGGAIYAVDYADAEDKKLLAAIVELDTGFKVQALSFHQEVSLFGSEEVQVGDIFDMTQLISGRPKFILVNRHADSVIVSNDQGEVFYLMKGADGFALQQIFVPFEDVEDRSIALMDYLFGDASLVFSNTAGVNVIYSLYNQEGATGRRFGQTKKFNSLPNGASFYDASLRNKAFLIGTGSFASIRYGTTQSIRWEQELPFAVQDATLGRKYRRILFLDFENRLHIYHLTDPHPEAGIKAFFGKIWYEGYSAPSFEWQSTGGTDDFESKLSLVPLIVGTLKGTFYALIFALPIALLAALYTSQFAHPRFRMAIKPTMEIMASLPSVVLGFLAALWLAPIVEDRIPSLILMILLIATIPYLFGACWSMLPAQYRKIIAPGYEWLVLVPMFFIVAYLGWIAGPHIERIFFLVRDQETGKTIADFRLWWPKVTGTPFEQRNSLVVGFIMGFAAIPIIFTIAEDSLSNVPKTLRSGSLALGASRWQTAIGVILPTAFPGIFSATMVGFGRAVGETMIVVMATGNTPIMDFNIFSGMRTLSANIAVELPEAPYLGTLYRTLFLGALLLFIMTFIVNMLAEIIRQRIREKYKMV